GYGTVHGKVTPIPNDAQIAGVVNAINSSGQVVVNENNPVLSTFKLVIYNQDGSKTNIVPPAGQTQVTGMGINDAGQVAGYTRSYSSAQAFLFSKGAMHSLGTLPGDTSSQALALNNSGQVVGISQSL